MKFLKRKFLLPMIGIVGLLIIGLLHAMLFAERGPELAKIRNEVGTATAEKNKIKLLANPRDLKNLKTDNKHLKSTIDDVAERLKAKKPVAFYPAERSRVEVDIPEDAKAEEKTRIVDEAFAKEKEKNDDAQYALIVGEIRKLWKFTPERGGNSAGETKLPFLGEGAWRVPTSLVRGLEAAEIRDILREATGAKEFMEIISPANKELRRQQKSNYDAQIRRLGIENRLYADATGGSLAAQGEYIPLLHKLCIAIMLEDELASAQSLTAEPVSREKLFGLMEIGLPTGPLLNEAERKEPISDLYFMYEGLRFANSLIELAVNNEIKEVSKLKIEEASYLVNIMDEGKYPWHEPGISVERAATAPIMSPYVLVKDDVTPQTVIAGPANGDIGYCIPVSLQFRATNLQGWNFIYNVLREHPLAEVNDLAVTAVRGPNTSGELIWRITILGVPLLFVMDEDIRPDARKFSFSTVSAGGSLKGLSKKQQALAELAIHKAIVARDKAQKQANMTDEQKARMEELRGGGKKKFFFF